MSPLLFAYGTLMPADTAAADRDGWRPDAVRGRLFDLGPYPALVDLDEPGTGWVEGFVRPVDIEELETRLDPWEEVDQGLYRRDRDDDASILSRLGLRLQSAIAPDGTRPPRPLGGTEAGAGRPTVDNQPREILMASTSRKGAARARSSASAGNGKAKAAPAPPRRWRRSAST